VGPLRKSEDPSIGNGKKCDVESRYLQGCIPACVGSGPRGWYVQASIERTDRMLVYGSSKPSSMSLTVVWLSPLLLWL
jgi:hypothetical protein